MACAGKPAKVPQKIDVTQQVAETSLKMAMKMRSAKNESLDLLARELVKAAALDVDDIERIAGGEHLYASVRARIVSDRVVKAEVSNRFTPAHRVLLVSSAAIVIVAGIFAATVMMDRRLQRFQTLSNIAPAVTEPLPAGDQPKGSTKNLGDITTRQIAEQYTGPRFERAVYQAAARRPVRRPQPADVEKPAEFYALADLHPSEEAANSGRIVRVELPKASLVALGVNIPLDEDRQTFKTDLLVGPDGVPRAIRLVD